MLRMLGLSHVGQTVVGDENLRGVSGGQKRRLTVGEIILNPVARFFCLDNITDGLASTDSLSLIEAISKTCKEDGLAAVISLLQPSDEIIETFNTMLVLSSDGQTTYFGPVDRKLIRSMFLGENTDNSEVDSGAIADLVMNQTLSNKSLASPFLKDYEVAHRFLDSPLYYDLVKDLGVIRAGAPRTRDRYSTLKTLFPDEKYSKSGILQFMVIARRRIKLILRNPMTYMRVLIAMVFGVIVGSLFSALKQDVIGALGRTGVSRGT